MYSVLSTGTRILPSRSAKYRASIAAVSPKVEVTEAWRNRSRDQPGSCPRRKWIACTRPFRSSMSGKNWRLAAIAMVAASPSPRDGEQEVRLAKSAFSSSVISAERRISSGDQAVQKSVFAVLTARFVSELSGHDLRDDDAVGNGR